MDLQGSVTSHFNGGLQASITQEKAICLKKAVLSSQKAQHRAVADSPSAHVKNLFFGFSHGHFKGWKRTGGALALLVCL